MVGREGVHLPFRCKLLSQGLVQPFHKWGVTFEHPDVTASWSPTALGALAGRGLFRQSCGSMVKPRITPGRGRTLDK